MMREVAWVATFLLVFVAASFASRRFAAAVRRSGGSLLADQERRAMFYERPIGSFGDIVRDDVSGLSELFKRQASPAAERWRITTWVLFILGAAAFVFGRRLFASLSGTIDSALVRDFTVASALLVAFFWAAAGLNALRMKRSRQWIFVCAIGAGAAIATATLIGFVVSR